MSEETKDQNQQNQQQDSSKVAKSFDRKMSQMIAVLGGKDLLVKHPKIGGDDLTNAVKELVKEEKENLAKEFKKKAVALIASKNSFDKFVAEEQKKIDKSILDKKKEFIKEADALFGMIDRIENLEKSYYTTLTDLAKDQPPEPEISQSEEGQQEQP